MMEYIYFAFHSHFDKISNLPVPRLIHNEIRFSFITLITWTLCVVWWMRSIDGWGEHKVQMFDSNWKRFMRLDRVRCVYYIYTWFLSRGTPSSNMVMWQRRCDTMSTFYAMQIDDNQTSRRIRTQIFRSWRPQHTSHGQFRLFFLFIRFSSRLHSLALSAQFHIFFLCSPSKVL